MNANGQTIETLTNSRLYRDYERAYSEVIGLPVALRPLETWQLPLHGRHKENSFCSMMAETSRSCAACLQTQEALARAATSEPATLTCAYGLWEIAVPVKLGARTIGFLQTGQVMRQKPTAATFRRAVEHAAKLGVNIDNDRAREAYLKSPIVPQRKLDAVSTLLTAFASHLSMMSNQIAVHTANAEPTMITRAKVFIEEHHTQALSLGQVAQAAHTSLFYFCKLFKKTVGINFTDYVSRLRTEKAKDLLLNPNLRVSEIAYEVGFQSLTHFNRVFRKVVGESPTAYRRHLPAGT
jgi:AraC-like DNA-binding protein